MVAVRRLKRTAILARVELGFRTFHLRRAYRFIVALRGSARLAQPMASLVKAGYSLTDVEDTAKEDKLGATLAALTPSSFRHTQAAPAMDGEIKRMIEQKMAGESGVASMLGTRRSSVIRSRALKAAMLGTIETAVEVNDQELKKKSRACSIL